MFYTYTHSMHDTSPKANRISTYQQIRNHTLRTVGVVVDVYIKQKENKIMNVKR